MEESVEIKQVDELVFRLRRPIRNIPEDLLKRGINADALDEVREAISEHVPLSPEDAILESFRERAGQNPPFSQYRYGDGSYGVFYSALDEQTSVEEIRYHSAARMREDRQPRTLQLFACDFSGRIVDLVGLEDSHPELVSQDTRGYPFCHQVAKKAISQGADALHAPSARNVGGVCVPIFTPASVANPRHQAFVEFRLSGDNVEAQRQAQSE